MALSRGLADETRQLALLIRSVTDYAIYMLDPDGYIRSWNPGGERIKGYSDREIVGQHFSRFYTPEDVARGEPARGLQCARTQGKFEAEGWRLRKDGTRFWASVVIDPIWQDGTLIGFAKVTRDVTERHVAQLRLQEAQQALAQSQKIEAIGKLTLGLAHDFNNLLTVIVNSLDLIEQSVGTDARMQGWIEAALRAADRGTLLTRQLLAFGRGQRLAPEEHDINALLQHSGELYRRACGAAVEFHFDFADALPRVWVDAAQFEAAILNLVVNSRDAMPSGGTIVVRTQELLASPPESPDTPARRYVAVDVIDPGTGMSQAIVERAIEPFFTTKEVGRGSGLGLSQVFGFALQTGGFATLHSDPGHGTTVRICLPLPEEAGDG
ncbi:PAS domain S-box protein [Lysobacter sp. LF1]|uniref:histidine kinase n=1 Tax=Lysobacter stagni TaxID=3045172 RepID=A0ABT6XKG3_9GAMM|nr:PAS domain-containing sensor histidine kinase [Lysobacter sp. LF1]MDI9240660.1 PAS domain S-box protein [Lysobacter sp. LF1]